MRGHWSYNGLTVLCVGLATFGVAVIPAKAAPTVAATDIVSLASNEQLGNAASSSGGTSAGGRYVTFFSHATNLVPNDTNGQPDVFVRDRLYGSTELVSASRRGTPGNHASFDSAITDDGQFVAFVSKASNLVANDDNRRSDAFVRDLYSGKTELVSVNLAGTSATDADVNGVDISADGRFVVFTSEADDLTTDPASNHEEVFIRDRALGVTELVSVRPNGMPSDRDSQPSVSVSADGRFIAFVTRAGNLGTPDDNRSQDVYVRDRQTGTTALASMGLDGKAGPGDSLFSDLSDNGRYVSFSSNSNNLVPNDGNSSTDVFVRDLVSNQTRRISLLPDGSEFDPTISAAMRTSISASGRYVGFDARPPLLPGLTGDEARVYLWDRASNQLQLISVNSSGDSAFYPTSVSDVAPHGHFVAFWGAADLAPSPTDDSQAYLRVLP